MTDTPKVELAIQRLDNLQPAPAGSRYEIADALISGLRIRVSDDAFETGRFRGKASRISFVLLARFPPSHNPTRRVIGRYVRGGSGLTLQKAREIAVDWKGLIRQGIDPAESLRRQKLEEDRLCAEAEAQRQKEEEALRNRKSLKDVLDRYEREHLVHLARGKATRRALDGEEGALKDFLDRDPASITRSEISQAIKAKAVTAPASANGQLAYAKAFFNWCVEEEILEHNPAEKLKKPAKDGVRDRHHSLAELKEIWAATATPGYPFQQLIRLLIAVPMRREEIAAISLSELSFGKGDEAGSPVWTLPAGRTKNRNALRVPLPTLAVSLINEAIDHPDRPKTSGFVFSTTGVTSVSGFSKAKRRLEETIATARQKEAAKIGVEPEGIAHWTIHDLRTTFNTMACDVLAIEAHVADRILNHVATATTSKVMRIYNRSGLFEQRKRALQAWSDLLEKEVLGRSQGSDESEDILPATQ